MAQNTTWAVNVGKYSGASLSLTDHASRTLGLSIDQQADAGQLGTGQATVTLDNSDGALTPGGSGTYANVDWLTSGLFLEATVDSTSVSVFHGVITDFAMTDDGNGNSAVTLTALDAFQVIGFQDRFTIGVGTDSTAALLYYIMSSHFTANSTQVPTIGLSTMRVWWEELNATADRVPHFLVSATHALGDVIGNNIMPNQQTVALPTVLDDSNTYSAFDSWVGFTVDGLARADVYTTGDVFVFTENDPSPTGQLPFRALVRDFHNDLITNSAKITSLDTSTTQTYDDDDSRQRYGTRARSYEITAFNDAQVLTTAQLWVNRYSYDETFDMTAAALQVSDSMVQSRNGDVAKWRALLDVTVGWWNTGSVTYTPTGGSSRTDQVIIAGRTIDATPADTTVTLKLRPQKSYLPFILDDTERGVLDTNKLG
jgi:hypothetical protein